MKTIWKAAIAILGLGMLAGCQPYNGYYDDGYYGGAGYGGYCDSYGCPDDYWDRPVYYGSVYYGGAWVNGPFYYRDYGGRRQFWLRGGWRDDGWRGTRPSQYRNFRYGPALGRDFYRNRFDNRPGFTQGRGGRDFDRDNDGRPDLGRGGRGRGDNDNRPGFGQGRGGDFGGRGSRGAQPPQQAQPPQNGGRGFQRMDSAPRGSSDGRALTPPDRRFGRDGAGPPRNGDGGSRGGRGRGSQ